MEAVHALKSALTENEARAVDRYRRACATSVPGGRPSSDTRLCRFLTRRTHHRQVGAGSRAGDAAIAALKATVKACSESKRREDKDVETVAHFGLVCSARLFRRGRWPTFS